MTVPPEFLRACILLILSRSTNYGYGIRRGLRELGFDPDPARTYRLMRTMEADGVVTSMWASSSLGPKRRNYVLTDEGKRELTTLVEETTRLRDMFQTFLQEAACVRTN